MEMMFYLFLLKSLIAAQAYADTSSSFSTRVTDMVQDLCPGVNICRESQTTQATMKASRPGTGSCCTECSCVPNCTNDGNCCFPLGMSHQRNDDTATQTGAVCLVPTLIQPSVEKRKRFQSYYMISSVPKNSVYDIKAATKVPCGEKHVAPWGSLYPVFSPKRKRIYKNIACALADGVHDGKIWDAEIICDDDEDSVIDASSFVLGLDSNSIHSNCRVNFIYQGDPEEIRSSICYINPINTCNASGFQMPNNIDASKAEIIEACTSGFISPYTHSNLYANVFCHICNDEYYSKDDVCPARYDYISRGNELRGFIGLIDGNFIAESRQEYLRGTLEYPIACSSQLNRGCRRVFCPSGQLHNRVGKCRYPHVLWYGQEYSVFINLTANEYINVYEVFKIKPGQTALTLPDLKSPWKGNWRITFIYYTHSVQSKNVTHFVVLLKNKMSEVKPYTLVKTIRTFISREWLLRYNNITLVLKSNFEKTRGNFLLTKTESKIVLHNHTETIIKPTYKMIYRTHEFTVGHLITELYQCDQVELIKSDFILSLDKTVLFNTITSRFLFDGEFVLIASTAFESVRARVCIADSGLYRENQSEFMHGSSLCKEFSVWLLVVAWFVLSVHRMVFTPF